MKISSRAEGARGSSLPKLMPQTNPGVPPLPEVVRIPDIYPFAAHIGRRLGCTHVVDIGCGRGDQLAELFPEFEVVGLDVESNLESYRSRYRFGHWINWDPESEAPIPVPEEILPTSVVVCSRALHRLTNSGSLLTNLKKLMDYAPVAIVSTPLDDSLRARDRLPSVDESHLKESNREGLESLLERAGFHIEFIGLTATDNVRFRKESALAVLANNHAPPIEKAPASFRVVALMAAYNEEDVIASSLAHLIHQGVEVYLIDNWSTDRTLERARSYLGRGVLDIERFPPDGPSDTFDYMQMLNHKEEVATRLKADWYMHIDADELRTGPWPNVSLKDALYHVDRLGFNLVDHTVLTFHPIDNGYSEGVKLEDYFRFFEFDWRGFDLYFRKHGHHGHLKTWKNTGVRALLADGGHEAVFAGRLVYPYNFLTKHYQFRSQQHGEKKAFSERKARYDLKELAMGWHGHLNTVVPGYTFLRDPAELIRFQDEGFHDEYLLERLANIGPDAPVIKRQVSRSQARSSLRRLARRIIRRGKAYARKGGREIWGWLKRSGDVRK